MDSAPTAPGMDIYIRKFGKELHQRVRVRAAREGITIRDFIMRACSNELRRSGEAEPAELPVAHATRTGAEPATKATPAKPVSRKRA